MATLTRLEKAGAVILGKANLSEWTNFRSTHSTSGWRAVGGLTAIPTSSPKVPADQARVRSWRSRPDLIPLTIGTETDGSLA